MIPGQGSACRALCEIIPRTESLAAALGLVPVNQSMKAGSLEQSDQLTEQTNMAYRRASSLALGYCFSWLLNIAPQGGFFSMTYLTTALKTVFGQE
jgi:hypothetical protein